MVGLNPLGLRRIYHDWPQRFNHRLQDLKYLDPELIDLQLVDKSLIANWTNKAPSQVDPQDPSLVFQENPKFSLRKEPVDQIDLHLGKTIRGEWRPNRNPLKSRKFLSLYQAIDFFPELIALIPLLANYRV
jgi:hypothetical protein